MFTAETNTLMFHQTGDVASQAEYYDAQLAKLGWNKNPSSEITDGVAFLDYSKNQLNLTITINPRQDRITTMVQGSGIKVAPESEEESDDSAEWVDDDGSEGE